MNRAPAKFCGKCGLELPEPAGSADLARPTLPATAPRPARRGADDSTLEWRTPEQLELSKRYAAAPGPSGGGGRLTGNSETEPGPNSREGTRFGSEPLESLGDDETLADLRLERLVADRIDARERRGRTRALMWGVLAAAVLGFLIAGVVVGAGLWQGRQNVTGAQRTGGQPPEATTAMPPEAHSAPQTASSPPASASAPADPGRPSVTDRATDQSPPAAFPERSAGPATLPPRSDQPAARAPRSESPAPAQRSESAPRRAAERPGQRPEAAGSPDTSEARSDSVGLMAENLIARHGPEHAERTAVSNATWYQPGSSTHTYWQRVADAIRKAPGR